MPCLETLNPEKFVGTLYPETFESRENSRVIKRLSVKNPNQFVLVYFFKFIAIKFKRRTGSKHCIISLKKRSKLYFILTIGVSGCVV